MGKLLFTIITISLFLFPIAATANPTQNEPSTEEEAPSYAQWGRIAMQATKERYPEAAIIDYLHIGAITRDGITTEKFKLWLRGKEKEFGVYIDIRYNKETEEMIDITFQETDR